MKDLSITQAGRALVLSFTLPRQATDGRRLTKPLTVEVFRQAISQGAQGASGSNKAKTPKPFATIGPRELPGFEGNGKVNYPIRLAAAEYSQSIGERWGFNIVVLTRGYRNHPHPSEPSNQAAIELLNVSQPVVNLAARQVPHAIELTWSAPRASLTGGPLPALAGYRIYRAVQSQSGGQSLAEEAPSASFRDTTFQFGTTYIYTVAAVFTRDGFTATSAPSAPVVITPRQIFPPAPPRGLTAVYTGSSVELIWKPEIDPHLAGYNVYRQEPGKPAQSARRLNPQPLRTPAFSDRAIQQDTKYIYWVTAVDTAGNESIPSARAAVETR